MRQRGGARRWLACVESLAVAALALLLAVTPSRVPAQESTRDCPPIDSGVHLRCQVDRAAIPVADWAPPVYPPSLLHAGREGSVRIRYPVDSLGRPVAESLLVVRSSDALLTEAVLKVRPGYRFVPAERAGRPVAMWYEEEIVFVTGGNAEPMPESVVIVSRDTTPDGIARLSVGTPRRDPAAARHFSNEALLDAQQIAVASLVRRELPTLPDASRPTLCIAMHVGGAAVPVSASLQQDFARAGLRSVDNACPPPFSAMIATVGPNGRVLPPALPGGTDAILLRVLDVSPWTRELLHVRIEVTRGATRQRYRCALRRVDASLLPLGCTTYA